jgi:hypothetical protein
MLFENKQDEMCRRRIRNSERLVEILNVIKINHLGCRAACAENNIKMHLKPVDTECEDERWVEIYGMGYMVLDQLM